MIQTTLGRKKRGGCSLCPSTEAMHRKPATVQFLKCKTLNCANSYKSVSSLRRHNKSCSDFIQVYCIADDPIQISSASRFSGSVAAAGDVGDEEDSSYSLEKAIEDNRNTIRDAACLCDPDDYEAHVTVSEDLRTQSETYGEAETATVHGQDDLSAKNRKEVILNPAGEFDPEKCFYLEDLIIDESQVKRLESYSWYGGVPQRDKAGQFFVWVHSDGVQGPTLHRVSQHARLYAQLLGRISSATKRMDARIVYLANSILKEGHSKNSFNFKGLIKWSFIEKLRLTESKEAMKLIQSLGGSASNRMRVIVGLCSASRLGKMRKKYFKVTPPSWVPQLSIILQGAILSDFGGMYSIRKQFYHQVNSWDGETITEELVESMPFLRLLYLFHKLGYFKASQVNRSPVAGGGDSVKWMSYFDEIEALCAVQAAFSDDFEYLLSPNAANYAKYINYVKEEGGCSSTLSSTSSSFYDLDVTTVTTPRLLSISTDSITNLADSYVHLNSNRSCLRSLCHINDDDIRVNHGDASIPVFVGNDTDDISFSYDDNYDTNYDSNNNNNIRDNEVQNGTSNETDFKSPNFFSSNLSSDENSTDYNAVTKRSGTDFSWAAHVRTMCEMCGESLKLDKDRVCTDGYSPSQVSTEISIENKILAEKIIRIRNYAFLIWKIFDTPTDKINLNIINNKILTGNSNNTASSYGIDDISDLNNNYSRSLSSLPLSSIPLQVPEQLSPLLLSHLNTCSTLKVPLPMNISNNITTSTLPVPQDMNPVMNLLSSASVVSDVSESVFSDASISYEVTKKKRKRGKNHQKCLLENGNESPKKMKNVKYSKKKDHKKEDFETYY